jgi:hypothetical protein
MAFFNQEESPFSSYFTDNFIRVNLFFSLVTNIFLWLFLSWYSRKFTSDIIPLHYNIYFGIDFFDKWYKIFYLPLSGSLILAFNGLSSVMIFRIEKILSYFLIGFSSFIQLILIISVSFILFINL